MVTWQGSPPQHGFLSNQFLIELSESGICLMGHKRTDFPSSRKLVGPLSHYPSSKGSLLPTNSGQRITPLPNVPLSVPWQLRGSGLSPTLVGPGPHGYLRTPLFSIKDVCLGILAPRASVSHSLLLSTRRIPGGSAVKNPPAVQETQNMRV